MKSIKCLTWGVILTSAIATSPAFAQVGGLAAGVGLGGQTKAAGGAAAGAVSGVGAAAQTGVGAQAGANAGVKSRTDAQTNRAGVDAGSNGAVAARIQSNPELAARVQSMLPSGMSVNTASAGFKNEGQFLAALHASQNLNVPFEQLKAKMTGSAATSLGAAIQAAKPDLNTDQAAAEAKKAETQAKATSSAKASAASKVNASSASQPGKQPGLDQ